MPTDDVFRLRPTPRYRNVLRLAEEHAKRHGHRHLGVEHLMLAILQDGRSVPAVVLQKLVDLGRFSDELERILISDDYAQSTSAPGGPEEDIPRCGSVVVPLVRADERQQGVIHWAWQARNGPDDLYRARLEWSEAPVDVSADDVFEALARIREQLEPQGWLIAVQGSRLDAFPTAIQRELSAGLNASILPMGESAEIDEVETFAEAEPSTLATVAAQRERAQEWVRSMRPGGSSKR